MRRMASATGIRLPYNFVPRSYQRVPFGFWQSGCRRFFDLEHRRAGKTRKWLSLTVMSMIMRVGGYAHIFPELKQAREVIWEGIGGDGMRYLDHFPKAWIYGQPNKAEMSVTLRKPLLAAMDQGVLYPSDEPGSRWVLLGTDRNVNAAVGSNLVGIVWDEWALQDPQARRLARPILAENGGWEAVCTTPRGENHAYDLHEAIKDNPDWCVQRLTVDDTRRDGPHEHGGPVITDTMIQADRAEGVDEATIEQEYYLSWQAPMPGAYYAEDMRRALQQGRIALVDWDPRYPVSTSADFGTSVAHDTNAWWFVQLIGNRVHVIDYECHYNKGVPFYVDMLKSKGYSYRVHFAMQGDLDEASWESGKSRFETFKNHGIVFTPVPKLRLIEGVNAVRELLPRCWFAEDRCRDGINGLRSFRREWDEANRIFRNTPVHDWSSHPEAAFRYLAVGLGDPYGEQQRRIERGPRAPVLGAAPLYP